MAFLDDFTVASDTNLEDHTPSGGTAWTLAGGVAAAAIVYSSTNTLRSRTTTASYYTHDDQGSANQYVQARLKTLAAFPDSYVCCRLVDASNFVGWRCYGTGTAGLRLSESVSGTVTDKYTFQGVDETVYKVEVDGTTARIYANGSQQGTDQTVGSSSETSQGVRIGTSSTVDWIDDYEAGALSGGAQSLTPSLYSNNQTFYAPTVAAGSVTLAPSLVTNSQTFYAPTITGGIQIAAWPAGLPSPSISGYSLSPHNQTVRTEMEVGNARVRRRSAARLDLVDVSWVFDNSEMQTFRTWFEDSIGGGESWFTIDLATGATGIASIDARFARPFTTSLRPGLNWSVEAQLETRT